MKGNYQYEDPGEAAKCVECPKELICAGRNITWPRAGYWRNSPTTTYVPQCFQQDACLY